MNTSEWLLVATPGACRICGCTALDPCVLIGAAEGLGVETMNCGWLDEDRTLCSNPVCVAEVPLDLLVAITKQRGGLRSRKAHA